jgi:hypothetical protein
MDGIVQTTSPSRWHSHGSVMPSGITLLGLCLFRVSILRVKWQSESTEFIVPVGGLSQHPEASFGGKGLGHHISFTCQCNVVNQPVVRVTVTSHLAQLQLGYRKISGV